MRGNSVNHKSKMLERCKAKLPLEFYKTDLSMPLKESDFSFNFLYSQGSRLPAGE